MNKWMKTYWRTRNQAKFLDSTPSEFKYAIKKDDKSSINNIIADRPGNIEHIDYPSEELQLAAVNSAPWVLGYIGGDGPTEEVQLAAVTADPSQIYELRYSDISLKVQMAAVTRDGSVIRYIKNPPEEVKIAAVRNQPLVIKEIKNASLEVQIAAMESDDYACDVFSHLTDIYYSNNYDWDLEVYTDEIPYKLLKIALENCGYMALRWLSIYHTMYSSSHKPSISEELKKVYIMKHYIDWIDQFTKLNIEISEDLLLWALENRKIYFPNLDKFKETATPKVREYIKKYYYTSI